MSAIRKSLLQLMFSGSYMRRWNDKLRPVELYEIDKQAHKMIVAWMLTLLNSGGYSASDQLKLQQEVIERGLFDYLYRLVTTDIKPPVFYRICENEKDYKELTEWVLKELRPVLGAPDEGFWERLSAYHRNRDRTSLPDRILTAAHHYASGWEYNVIKPFNTFDEENQSIAESFTERLDGLTDLCGVNELIQGHAFFSDSPTALGRFAKLCRPAPFPDPLGRHAPRARKPPCSGTCSSLRVTRISSASPSEPAPRAGSTTSSPDCSTICRNCSRGTSSPRSNAP